MKQTIVFKKGIQAKLLSFKFIEQASVQNDNTDITIVFRENATQAQKDQIITYLTNNGYIIQ